jgi:hypothetical protein
MRFICKIVSAYICVYIYIHILCTVNFCSIIVRIFCFIHDFSIITVFDYFHCYFLILETYSRYFDPFNIKTSRQLTSYITRLAYFSLSLGCHKGLLEQ